MKTSLKSRNAADESNSPRSRFTSADANNALSDAKRGVALNPICSIEIFKKRCFFTSHSDVDDIITTFAEGLHFLIINKHKAHYCHFTSTSSNNIILWNIIVQQQTNSNDNYLIANIRYAFATLLISNKFVIERTSIQFILVRSKSFFTVRNTMRSTMNY